MRKTNIRSRSIGINFKNIILEHVNNNLKDYTVLILFFIVGVILGVIFINNTNQSQQEEISKYINGIISSLQGDYVVDSTILLKTSIIENVKLAITLWFVGSTVIGVPFIYGIIAYRGFCIGYTCASIIATIGIKKGILFLITGLFLQNILFIPCLLGLCVSGLRLYKSIIKDKRRENIKTEIYRHTVFCFVMLIGLICSSVIETYVSSGLFTYSIRYL